MVVLFFFFWLVSSVFVVVASFVWLNTKFGEFELKRYNKVVN